MAKRKFEVTVQYSFTGKYQVLAENESEVHDIVMNGAGMVAGEISSNDTRVVDWEFPVHPEESIESILVKE